MKQERLWVSVLIFLLFIILLSSFSPFFVESETVVAFNQNWLGTICHTYVDRSLEFDGFSTILCARCSGIYVALLIGLLWFPFFHFGVKKEWKVYLIIFFIVANAVDVLGSVFLLWNNSILSRFILGSFFGISLSFLFTKTKS